MGDEKIIAKIFNFFKRVARISLFKVHTIGFPFKYYILYYYYYMVYQLLTVLDYSDQKQICSISNGFRHSKRINTILNFISYPIEKADYFQISSSMEFPATHTQVAIVCTLYRFLLTVSFAEFDLLLCRVLALEQFPSNQQQPQFIIPSMGTGSNSIERSIGNPVMGSLKESKRLESIPSKSILVQIAGNKKPQLFRAGVRCF